MQNKTRNRIDNFKNTEFHKILKIKKNIKKKNRI